MTPGNTVAIPPVEGAERVTITRPDGKSRTIPVSTDQASIPFSATETPGTYQVVYTGGGKDLLTDAFTVNVGDELESDLRPGRPIDLSSIAGGTNTTPAAGAPQRRGVGVAPWLLAGVLILLAAEWLVMSRRSGDAVAPHRLPFSITSQRTRVMTLRRPELLWLIIPIALLILVTALRGRRVALPAAFRPPARRRLRARRHRGPGHGVQRHRQERCLRRRSLRQRAAIRHRRAGALHQ